MKITDDYVFFWKENPFCNFTKCKIKFADPYFVPLEEGPLVFSSSEQLFMWLKAKFFGDDSTANKIYLTTNPEEARKLGREVKNYDDTIWNTVRVDYMRKAVFSKFIQNKEFRTQLIDPKYDNKVFVEASPYDKIWGIGYSENDLLYSYKDTWGRNELGKILTDIRTKLKEMDNLINDLGLEEIHE